MNSRLRRSLFAIMGAVLIGALGVGIWQWYRIATRPSMEKSGGTVLVYELDVDRLPDEQLPAGYQSQELADALRRRLDFAETLGIGVRPVEANRVEISIPRSGDHDARVAQVKELVQQVGLLEFRILANEQDDAAAIAAARANLEDNAEPEKRRAVEERRAARGLPPQPPRSADGKTVFPWSNRWGSGEAGYSWVELSRGERHTLGLDNAAETDPQRHTRWQEVAKARDQGHIAALPDDNRIVLWSRRCQNLRLSPTERESKRYEYFLLTRDPKPEDRVTSQFLERVTEVADAMQQPAVDFRLSPAGGERFHTLTSQNRPNRDGELLFSRHLAILLDDLIMTAPQLRDAIRADARITGNFTQAEVANLVAILRAGALPASLKPEPVSETVVEPTAK